MTSHEELGRDRLELATIVAGICELVGDGGDS